MAGKEGGVNRIIRELRVHFFHGASHKLNLVINDLNQVHGIRNTLVVIKATIRFFRGSILRRKLVPNVPMLCETRWSAKYKSIRVFAEQYETIVLAFESFSSTSNSATRTRDHIIRTAITRSTFIVCLNIVAKYSVLLEPVANVLQGVSVELSSTHDHITELMRCFKDHRTNAALNFEAIMRSAREAASLVGAEIAMPRQASRQTQRDGVGYQSSDDYYRVAFYIPYVESLIASLELRFSPVNKKSCDLFQLHPNKMKGLSRVQFSNLVEELQFYYCSDNLKDECLCWYEM